ncbi:hypothetical protein T11_18392 [Trichinella zimbabwensis]|uniref:Uncharacterized protein n=1 Tax=Trichinella zimbabwensis TaxID=268475 RepID=A0A0V1GQ80_9BILA|nr:hypothetical protein T11_18392 [Trichinella zimbabwensis]
MTLSIRRQDMERGPAVQNRITDISRYKVCLLHHWISIEFDLAAMDYISALEQVWSHSATAV